MRSSGFTSNLQIVLILLYVPPLLQSHYQSEQIPFVVLPLFSRLKLVTTDYFESSFNKTAKFAIINWHGVCAWIRIMVIFFRVVVDILEFLKKHFWW